MESFPFCAVHYIFRLNYLNFPQLKTNVLYSVLSFFVHLLFFYDTSDGSGIIEIFSVMIATILDFLVIEMAVFHLARNCLMSQNYLAELSSKIVLLSAFRSRPP